MTAITYPAGMVLWCGPDNPSSRAEAIQYCKDHGITKEDAAIRCSEGEWVKVILRRQFTLVAVKK